MAQRKATKTRKLSGLKIDGTPNKAWTTFKERLDSYADIPLAKWTAEEALGHILKRYRDHMGVELSLSHSGPPTSCSEIYCVKRMILALGISEGQTVKDYIDFVFDKYIMPNKVTFSSIAYFFTTNFIFEFKKKFRKDNKITRSTEIPDRYKTVIASLSLDVKTYGDLAFAKVAISDDPNNQDLAVYSQMFEELKGVGFDESVLGRLDGN
jgi:hypothetical protein